MRWYSRLCRASRSQSGFTVVEVFIASILMVMASMGLLSLFDSSIQLSGIARETKDAQNFARTVSERIRSLPFYRPYAATTGNADVDDYFWGTAEQHGGNIRSNNWDTNPFISCTLVTDPRFTCQVKMAYVLDSLDTANMKSDWLPKADSTVNQGKDKPQDANSLPFKIIKYEVKVGWKVTRSAGADKTYSYVSLMTNTQFQVNLGVKSFINTDDDSSTWGTGGEDSNTAVHTADDIKVTISGYGFKAGATARLVKLGCDDIVLDNINYVNGNTITAEADLANLATTNPSTAPPNPSTAPPWKPKRDPGKWTARVAIGSAFAYAYDAFEVQFPRPTPTINTLNPTSGSDSSQLLPITISGNNVLNLGQGTSPYTAYCGATIQLVNKADPTKKIIPRIDRDITYGGNAGYNNPNPNSINAVLNLRGATPGVYYVEIVNCKNNRLVQEAGNTTSIHSDSYMFTVTEGKPILEDVYVTGSVGDAVYVAPEEFRHFAYKGRDYSYKIRIDGTDLGAVSVVKFGINGTPSEGTSPDAVTATNVVADLNSNYVTAEVNFHDVRDEVAFSDSTYSWWVYCENSAPSTASGVLTGRFQIRKPRPILYKDAEYVIGSGPGGFYHNYAYNNNVVGGKIISAKLTGECFDTTDGSGFNINYKSGDYVGFMGNQTYTVGTSDGDMNKGSPSPTSNGTSWTTQLNLIHCKTGSNNIWVEKTDGTTDHNKTPTTLDPDDYIFTVTVVSHPNPTLDAKFSGAVSITNRFDDWWGTGLPGWQNYVWTGDSTESTAVDARAQRSNTAWQIWWGHFEWGKSTFKLWGQGFPDAIEGTTLVAVYNTNWLGSWGDVIGSGNYSVQNPTTLAIALGDRAMKCVKITTDEWQNVEADRFGRIVLGGTNYDRFVVNQFLQNN